MFGTILVGISGIAWTVVYIELIRRGFRERASIYSAFAQNAAMSAMFIDQLLRRPDIKAQSQSIAAAKWLGTLAPTIYGQLNDNPLENYILITGIVCCVFDLLYIALLRQRQRTLGEVGR